jgi:uracil-DNA glycosylase family 4
MDFEEFKHQLQNCRYCQRFGIEPKPFVGKEKSEKSAKIVQVSQQPSKSASESGIPFSDASGRKLIDEWYKIPRDVFLNPKLFYITGVAHCYSPNKKVAARLQRECSKKWLEQELSFLDPCLYIIIGKPAADFFFPNKKYIAELVFQNHVWKNKTAFVLPHPSSNNNRWFKDNPKFQSDRLNDIRKAVHEAIREFLEKH